MLKIYHLSDWHTWYDSFCRRLDWEISQQKLGSPDLVVLSGDMVNNMAAPDQRRPNVDADAIEERIQREHYERMVGYVNTVWPGADIVGVRGNHDWCDYGIAGSVYAFGEYKPAPAQDMLLCHGYKISGLRGIPPFYGYWKDEYREDQLAAMLASVPDDVDIFITHSPPHGVLDDVRDAICVCGKLNCHDTHLYDPDKAMPVIEPHCIGSFAIRDFLDSHPNIKLHCFGHVHERGGNVYVKGSSIVSNAAGTLNVIHLPEKDGPKLDINEALEKARKR